MGKKRKTRKEKMRSIIRQSSSVSNSIPVYSVDAQLLTTTLPVNNPTPIPNVVKTQYAYVLHDARQTGIITSLLFAASLVLYFLIQNHIVNLTMLGY